jgi:hypothetical protein
MTTTSPALQRPRPDQEQGQDRVVALMSEMLAADGADKPDTATRIAWALVAVLTEERAAHAADRLQRLQLIAGAQAAIAAAREGAADPLLHLRHALTPQGLMPRPDATVRSILAGAVSAAACSGRAQAVAAAVAPGEVR